MTILVEPINWEDNLGSSPPAQWQAVEEDNRYWITNNGDPYAVSQQRIDYIGEVSDLPTSLTFAWEIVTAPTEYEGDVIFFYNKGAGLDQINLGNEVGSGEVTVDLTGWDGFYWGVKVENIGFSSYGAVIAVGDVTAAADDFNCSCEDTTNHRTLGELRSEIITRLGFVTQKATTTGATLTTLRNYLLRRLGFAAQAANPPPGMTELLTEFVNEAIEAVWRSYAYDVFGGSAPAALVDGTDECTLDNWAVKTVALGNAKLHYGQSDGKTLLEQYETYLKNLLQRTPLNLASTVTSFLQDAQRQLYRNYASLRTERFYRWTMAVGERYYDLPDNEDDCGKKLDAYKITWVGVEDLNGTWVPLFEGINPTLYTGVNQPGLPARYEVRQCIEVFPAPDQAYTLRVKGHFGLEPFAADDDKTTVDDQAVFLLALAQAKAHYEQADAKNYFSQASNHIGSLVAGAHLTARYVPRSEQRASVPQPRMVNWDNE